MNESNRLWIFELFKGAASDISCFTIARSHKAELRSVIPLNIIRLRQNPRKIMSLLLAAEILSCQAIFFSHFFVNSREQCRDMLKIEKLFSQLSLSAIFLFQNCSRFSHLAFNGFWLSSFSGRRLEINASVSVHLFIIARESAFAASVHKKLPRTQRVNILLK
jgi:hypothetical protein